MHADRHDSRLPRTAPDHDHHPHRTRPPRRQGRPRGRPLRQPDAARGGELHNRWPPSLGALDRLAAALLAKGTAFDGVIKSGRTHLQDATPIRLGQECTAYGHTIARHREKLAQAADWLREMNIGGTAVGTGINAEPAYPALMVKHL